MHIVRVDIAPFVRKVWSNLHLVDASESLITQDESVMSGRLAFKGKRLPVDMAVGWNGHALDIQKAQAAYRY
jgi:uncharacterized protein (DUF433 family)